MTTTPSRWRPLRRPADAAPAEPVEPLEAEAQRHEVVFYAVLGSVALVAGALGVLATVS